MSVQKIPLTPLLYSKTGVCRGIPIFHIFAPKHRSLVLVRSNSVSTIYILSKNKKNIKNQRTIGPENAHLKPWSIKSS